MAIPRKRRRYPDSPAVIERHHEALRQKRFAQYFKRWQEGQRVRSYDTRWLAYLERQLKGAHRDPP